jgi:hypothetical protein
MSTPSLGYLREWKRNPRRRARQPHSDMYQFTADQIDLDDLRSRLRKMSDAQLLAFGKATRSMCSPAAHLGKPPRESFVIQLQEAREEWKRRRADISS